MLKDRVRAARERLGLSQAELAAELHVSQRSVGSWERGGKITPGNRTKLRDFFGSEIDEPQATAPASPTTDVVMVLATKLAEAERELDALRKRLARLESLHPEDERLIDSANQLTRRQRERVRDTLRGENRVTGKSTPDESLGSSERQHGRAGNG